VPITYSINITYGRIAAGRVWDAESFARFDGSGVTSIPQRTDRKRGLLLSLERKVADRTVRAYRPGVLEIHRSHGI